MDDMRKETAASWPTLYKIGYIALAGMVIFLLAVKGRAFYSISEALLLVVLLITFYKTRRFSVAPAKKVTLAFAFFAGGLLLPSLYYGEWKNIATALEYIYVMLTFFIMYIGTRCFLKEAVVYRAITIGAFVSAVLLVMAFCSSQIGMERLSVWDNPNTLADRLAMPVPFVFAAFYELKGYKLWRGINVASLLVILAGVVWTGSRGGIIGLICGLLAVGVLYWPLVKNDWSDMKKMIVSMVMIMMISSMVLATTMVVFPRDGSDNTRKNIMQAAYQMFEKNPLVGVGLENYVAENKRQIKIMQKATKSEKVRREIAIAARHAHSHNVLLYLLATTGIIGAGGYIAFFLIIWYCLLKGAIKDKRMGVVWAMMAAVISLNVHGLVDLSILHRITSWMFFGMLGLTLAMIDTNKESG